MSYTIQLDSIKFYRMVSNPANVNFTHFINVQFTVSDVKHHSKALL